MPWKRIFQKIRQSLFKSIQKQKNYCSRLYKKERKNFFNNLNPKFVSDNKSFWKTVKPLFSDKASYNASIKVTDKDKIVQNDEKVAEILNSFFENAISNLKSNENSFVINKKHKNIQDPIEKIIVKYQFYPSILMIKNRIKNNNFRFKHVMLSDIKNETKGLNPNKATTRNNIRPKKLRQSVEVTADPLQLLLNNTISNSKFPKN